MNVKLHATYDDGQAIECELSLSVVDNIMRLPPLDWPRIKEVIVKPMNEFTLSRSTPAASLKPGAGPGGATGLKSTKWTNNEAPAQSFRRFASGIPWFRSLSPDDYIAPGRTLKTQNCEDGKQ